MRLRHKTAIWTAVCTINLCACLSASVCSSSCSDGAGGLLECKPGYCCVEDTCKEAETFCPDVTCPGGYFCDDSTQGKCCDGSAISCVGADCPAFECVPPLTVPADCSYIKCPEGTYCNDKCFRGGCLPLDARAAGGACENVNCDTGSGLPTWCDECTGQCCVQVQCIQAPCPPICSPPVTCDTLQCGSGFACPDARGAITCVPTTPEPEPVPLPGVTCDSLRCEPGTQCPDPEGEIRCYSSPVKPAPEPIPEPEPETCEALACKAGYECPDPEGRIRCYSEVYSPDPVIPPAPAPQPVTCESLQCGDLECPNPQGVITCHVPEGSEPFRDWCATIRCGQGDHCNAECGYGNCLPDDPLEGLCRGVACEPLADGQETACDECTGHCCTKPACDGPDCPDRVCIATVVPRGEAKCKSKTCPADRHCNSECAHLGCIPDAIERTMCADIECVAEEGKKAWCDECTGTCCRETECIGDACEIECAPPGPLSCDALACAEGTECPNPHTQEPGCWDPADDVPAPPGGLPTDPPAACAAVTCGPGFQCPEVGTGKVGCFPTPVQLCADTVCIGGNPCVDTPSGPECQPLVVTCEDVPCERGFECQVSKAGVLECVETPVQLCADTVCIGGNPCVDTPSGPVCQPLVATCRDVPCESGFECQESATGLLKCVQRAPPGEAPESEEEMVCNQLPCTTGPCIQTPTTPICSPVPVPTCYALRKEDSCQVCEDRPGEEVPVVCSLRAQEAGPPSVCASLKCRGGAPCVSTPEGGICVTSLPAGVTQPRCEDLTCGFCFDSVIGPVCRGSRHPTVQCDELECGEGFECPHPESKRIGCWEKEAAEVVEEAPVPKVREGRKARRERKARKTSWWQSRWRDHTRQ